MKKWFSMILAAVMALSLGMTAMAYTPPVEDDTVYTSVEALYSAARAVYKEHKSGDYVFNMTDEVWAQITRFDDIYHQSFFTGDIFDFNGDQDKIPADEGDYLYHNYGGFRGYSVNDYSKTLTISSGSGYFTTLEEEAAFESALHALFASGGPLSHLKTAGSYEKVAGCLDYISQNVSYIGTNNGKYHSAYSALCGEKKATCQGYALLLYRMLRELGIANRILMVASAGAHTYNIVLLEGKYYYCDATSGAVLKGSNSFALGQLQEHYLTPEFQQNILSRISATDYPVPHTHAYANTYSSDAANHWHACSCGDVKDREAHTPGNWITDKPATVSEPGSQHKACTKCGYVTERQEIEKLPQPVDKEYDILDGGKETTYETKGEKVSIRVDGAVQKFVSVRVDGKEVDPKHYTVKEGSTIIIFTEEFLQTLSAGKHEVTFHFTDGTARANLTVAEAAINPPAPSEDPTDPTEATEPTVGEEPTVPTEATEPTVNEDPTVPTEATEPTVNEDPTVPTEVTEPTVGEEPTVPTEATEPTVNEDPTVPTEATEPTVSEDPTTQPTEPKPTAGENPTDPTEETNDAADTDNKAPGVPWGVIIVTAIAIAGGAAAYVCIRKKRNTA